MLFKRAAEDWLRPCRNSGRNPAITTSSSSGDHDLDEAEAGLAADAVARLNFIDVSPGRTRTRRQRRRHRGTASALTFKSVWSDHRCFRALCDQVSAKQVLVFSRLLRRGLCMESRSVVHAGSREVARAQCKECRTADYKASCGRVRQDAPNVVQLRLKSSARVPIAGPTHHRSMRQIASCSRFGTKRVHKQEEEHNAQSSSQEDEG